MKKVLTLALTAGVAATLYASSAEARPTCYARSPTGSYGIGWGPNFGVARRYALYYCAINTPRGYWCRIRWCRY